jgi:ABC-type multidrug transport system permease subunit
MYIGLGLLMGTIWLRLDRNQDSIQLLINALIVSCGFMSFMALTYVPAFIEDYQQYIQEHRNGLYGATRFSLCNFLVGMPYLFLFSLFFSILFYWLSNCHHSATAFLTWVMWLFFDLLAAEAIVVLSVSILPNFVGALVLVALINVLCFATGGTLVPPGQLNGFYKYVFYYWNYQHYVFQGMMVTQFGGQMYSCGEGCHCRYAPILTDQCHIAGETVLDQFGVDMGEQGRDVGIVVAIILAYRLAAWAVLKLKH